MDLKNKLLAIQQELKAPKGRNNRFGGYNYRSTEDIFTALKPLLKKYKVMLTITDTMELIGERYYVKATVCLEDVESETGISVSAYARETLERKKSDDSQLTGAASSYARKYALNGLFLIDDSADPDTYEDDPEELDRQEAEELQQEEEEEAPAPVRKPRQKKSDVAKVDKGTGAIVGATPEEMEDVADHDRYYFFEEEDNVRLIHAGEPAPEDGVEITKEQYAAASNAIATSGRNGRKRKSAKEAIEMAGFMNIPEGVDEEMPFFPEDEEKEEEPAEEEKPRTRRSRRKR